LTLANSFVQRPEFTNKYPTNQTASQFVDALLANVLSDSGADLSSQRTALIDLFNQGGTGMVLYRVADDSISTNPINNRSFIDAEYNRASSRRSTLDISGATPTSRDSCSGWAR
jgi:hypothetical protein